jgi:hypothetical protein
MGNLHDENSQLEFRKKLDFSYIPDAKKNLFNQFYHAKSQRWGLWVEDIERYSITGDKEKTEEEKKAEAAAAAAAQGSADDLSDSNSDIDEKIKVEEEPEIEYHQIMIATGDSIANGHLLDLLMRHEFPMMLVGGTGVGKTRQIKKYISLLVNSGEWESGEMVLSATESAENMFKYTQSKMDKHKKGLYGPKNPGNKLVMFIDDLNMPEKEKYGAQPPLELIR